MRRPPSPGLQWRRDHNRLEGHCPVFGGWRPDSAALGAKRAAGKAAGAWAQGPRRGGFGGTRFVGARQSILAQTRHRHSGNCAPWPEVACRSAAGPRDFAGPDGHIEKGDGGPACQETLKLRLQVPRSPWRIARKSLLFEQNCAPGSLWLISLSAQPAMTRENVLVPWPERRTMSCSVSPPRCNLAQRLSTSEAGFGN